MTFLFAEKLFKGSGMDCFDYLIGDHQVLTAGDAPYVIVQASAPEATRFERLVRAHRPHVEIVTPNDEEIYVIGKT